MRQWAARRSFARLTWNDEGSVSAGLRLNQYATTPLYNIKAVVQATNISPSTLRAWERRYNVCRPVRSESGYRLYSERDVAIIRWLKGQVDAGMSISQAVSWLDTIVDEAKGLEQAVLPDLSGNAGVERVGLRPAPRRDQVRDFASLQADLLAALTSFDEHAAETIMTEAFGMYSVEQVGESLLRPALVEIGERWHKGALSVATEHFASNYLIQRLNALLRTMPNGAIGPLIWVACAPTELHEVGALLLSVYLRRAGYRVHYLGQDLPSEALAVDMDRRQPAMLLFSASTPEAAEELGRLSAKLTAHWPSAPIVGYGGQVFSRRPDLRNLVAGLYLGDSALAAVDQIDDLLTERARQDH
jgi:methanogenic corrinoid protein MtbC1